MIDKNKIIEKLKTISYPGFSRDIISFGMIKDIVIQENLISIILIQSTNDEKILNQIKTKIYNEVLSIQSPQKLEVKVSIEPKPNENLNKTNLSINENIKHIIAIASGKGGVGKSTIAINLASELSKSHKVGLLDLDIYGPSLPTLIGEKKVPKITKGNLLVPIERFGMKFMSFGFLNSTNDPAIWRGPMVSKLTHQFFDNVDWGDLDYLILDLPPGTGDIQLTLVQKIALSGAVIITTPQDLAHNDVQKGSDMFRKVNTPVLGVIENMSYYRLKGKLINYIKSEINQLELENCDNKVVFDDDGTFFVDIEIFKGNSGMRESKRLSIPILGTIPLDPEISLLSDLGKPYVLENSSSDICEIFSKITNKIKETLNEHK